MILPLERVNERECVCECLFSLIYQLDYNFVLTAWLIVSYYYYSWDSNNYIIKINFVHGLCMPGGGGLYSLTWHWAARCYGNAWVRKQIWAGPPIGRLLTCCQCLQTSLNALDAPSYQGTKFTNTPSISSVLLVYASALPQLTHWPSTGNSATFN
jgi:hypothetical protein